MRITDVERCVVSVPLRDRCRPWIELLAGQWGVVEVIRLSTDSPDIVGYGETLLHYSWGSVSDEALRAVRGRNPADMLGRDDLGPGLQMAVYDVVGQALDVPAYRLFGPPKVREACALSWWSTKMPPETLAAEAKDAVQAGYLSHKFKARPWFDVFEQVEAISAVTPPHYTLDLDWNQMLRDAGTAKPVLRELDKYERIGIYETPIRNRDFEGFRRLRDYVAHPIAEHFGEAPFAAGLPAFDGYVLTGGVATVVKQASLAAEFGKLCWLQLVGTGITTAFTLHLGAVLPAAQWPAVTCMNIYADELLASPITLQHGCAQVPNGPGLGITVDESAISRLAMQPPYEIAYPDYILTMTLPGGRSRQFADTAQLWREALTGNIPAQERGARLHVTTDDGSAEFRAIRAAARGAP